VVGSNVVRAQSLDALSHDAVDEPAEPLRPHSFVTREIGVAAFAAAQTALGDVVMEGFVRTLGKPGFRHYVAYGGSRPVALAALANFDGIGYLTYASTVQADRGRGAQSALITQRVAAAKALGCTHVVSRTLTMLEHSSTNLQRAGFREVFEQQVFEKVLV
jgi:hypothetical protein